MPEQMDSDVYVRVDWADRSQPQTMWQYDKFMNRLYIMREMYQTWSEHNHSLANTDFADSERDPFFDPPEDQLVGEHANSSGVTLHKVAATPFVLQENPLYTSTHFIISCRWKSPPRLSTIRAQNKVNCKCAYFLTCPQSATPKLRRNMAAPRTMWRTRSLTPKRWTSSRESGLA
jgi:hypothetical protein